MKIYRIARHGGSEKERSIWYHGTTKKNLSAILSQGLIPNPKVRAWADDPSAGFSSPSRASLEGVYVTKNLMTAMGAAMRGTNRDESRIVVIMELQPRSLVTDEDDISYSIKDALFNFSTFRGGHEDLIIDAYMAKELGTGNTYITETRNAYAQGAANLLLKTRLGEETVIHPSFYKRLVKMLDAGWEKVLNRQAAYAYQHASKKSDYDWVQLYFRNISRETDNIFRQKIKSLELSGKSYDDAYREVVNEMVPARPDPSKAEADYATMVDEITKTCKTMVRPSTSKSLNQTGRSLEPIRFSGQNRIIGIVEVIPHVLYKETSEPYSDRVKLVYGTIPENFIKQWEERVGKLILL